MVAVVLALTAGVVLMGLIDLMTLPGWVDQQYDWEVPLEASWGALFTFLLGGSYLQVARRPLAPWPALVQLAVCAIALLISAGAGRDWRPLGLGLGVAGSALVLWLLVGQPSGPGFRRGPVRGSVAAVVALGLLLWLPYSIEAFRQSRAGVLGSVTQGIEHWPVQGAVGVSLLLSSVVLALWHDGRPLLRATISLSAVCIGMAELAYPGREGAMGSVAWGVGVTLWGLTVALVAVSDRCTTRGDRAPEPTVTSQRRRDWT